MLGSYPPQEAPQEVVWPRHGWEEAPSGMLARGSYKSTLKFIDDDDITHLQFDYGFSIKKDWGKDKEYVFFQIAISVLCSQNRTLQALIARYALHSFKNLN